MEEKNEQVTKETYPEIIQKENEPMIYWNEKEKERLIEEENLWTWNLVCGVLHLLQAMALLLLGLNTAASKFQLPFTTSFVTWTEGIPMQQHKIIGYLKFAPFTSTFCWLSALAHFLVLLNFKKYIINLRIGINTFRWYEYSLSASIMQLQIAMLFGIYDIISLILLLVVNSTTMLFGHLMETMNAKNTKIDWTAFIYGGYTGMIVWAILFVYLGNVGNLSRVPVYVWAITVSYLVMYMTFPLNMIMQYRRVGLWSDANHGYRMGGYYFGEKMYQILSILSKSLMIWIIFGGSSMPNPYAQENS